MFDELLTKIFGSRNDRLIKQYRRKCDAINKLEPAMQALSDEELKAKTQEFRDRIAKGATTDELLPEAFAVVREASVRVLGMRHFDVQLIGAMVLNDGKIAEMRTGEGKTLTATLAVYLNALPGKGCHVVTVNDYLASRDADWMGRLYNWLGLSVGKILSNQNNEEKRAAYASDITYGTNNEFGFDYLRDNMEYDSPLAASVRSTMRSSTKWTRFSLTRPARRSSSPAPPTTTRNSIVPSTTFRRSLPARLRKRARATIGSMRRPIRSTSPRPVTSISSRFSPSAVSCSRASRSMRRRTSS